jgi:uncharacterized membrane protein YagU involved in acid resistance
MNLRKMILTSLFLALGLVLHQAMPPILFGMKPDIMICMMFIAILLNKDDYKMALMIGIIGGLFSAMTSTFPGGQLPNVIDKLVTANCIFFLYKVLDKKFSDQAQIFAAAILGTLISGTVFLGSAALLVGLPGPFMALMLAVVIPATLMNAVGCSGLYNATVLSLKRAKVY